MQLLRLIHPFWWSKRDNKFVDFAFKPSSPQNGGRISVVDPKCASDGDGIVCSHLEKFYSEKFADPIVYWRFDSLVFAGCSLAETPGPRGCHCHREIGNVSANSAKKFFAQRFKETGWEHFHICEKGACSQMDEQNLHLWQMAHGVSKGLDSM